MAREDKRFLDSVRRFQHQEAEETWCGPDAMARGWGGHLGRWALGSREGLVYRKRGP